MLKMSGVGAIQLLEGLRALQAHSRTGVRQLRRVAAASASPGLFLREWVASPGGVGAIWPSSRRLADTMSARIPLQGDGLVVELGAGTGTVTQALLDKGISVGRLRVVERSPAFVQHLRKRFPAATVVHGDAADLSALLPEGIPVDAIVSSLPLRSLPAPDVKAILAQWGIVIRPGGLLVQFTYALHGQAPTLNEHFVQCPDRLVWRNLPPARVMTFVRLAH